MSAAADKLAKTRLAIVEHIHRKDSRHDRAEERRQRESEAGDGGWQEEEEPGGNGPAGWFGSLKHAAGAWWRHHPAHLGLELATPALSQYAGRKPLQFLAMAAVVGAVVVVARPWRLISATGLLVALLKSSQLSSLVMSAMSAADYQRDQPPRT
jgi:hypothetical protein